MASHSIREKKGSIAPKAERSVDFGMLKYADPVALAVTFISDDEVMIGEYTSR